MAEQTIMAFYCLNPDCKQLIQIPRPAKSGVYNVTCPHCGLTKQMQLKGVDAQAENAEEKPSKPDNSQKEPVELKEDFKVGEEYVFHCPHCGVQEFKFNTDVPGHRVVDCPYCKGKIGLEVRNKTEVLDMTDSIQRFRGKLTLLRRGWLNKDYPLSVGETVIGRHDPSSMSDISIKNDSSMSRRSISIETRQTEKGYQFKLTVLKATNPVMHNHAPLRSGESVSLNFGDSIVLGKTKFRFDRE